MTRKKKRKGGGRYVGIPHSMLFHAHFRVLSSNAVRTFIELKGIFNGVNNGYIALSQRDAAERCNMHPNTATRAFRELQYYGFILLRKQGHFGNRHASEYILTCESWNNQPATNCWKYSRPKMPKNWKPENNPRHKYCDCRSSHKDRTDYLEEQSITEQGL